MKTLVLLLIISVSLCAAETKGQKPVVDATITFDSLYKHVRDLWKNISGSPETKYLQFQKDYAEDFGGKRFEWDAVVEDRLTAPPGHVYLKVKLAQYTEIALDLINPSPKSLSGIKVGSIIKFQATFGVTTRIEPTVKVDYSKKTDKKIPNQGTLPLNALRYALVGMNIYGTFTNVEITEVQK